MKRCSASPYEGNEKYIFISYCRKDKEIVYPLIERMAKDGYRIWYDEGINPGTDWPEMIAEHLNKCSACIALITENSINSHNCRKEINYALFKKKPFISVFLEKVTLSVGMEMQLATTQAIFKYTYDSFYQFLEKLYHSNELNSCKGDCVISIVDKDEYKKTDKTKKLKIYLARKNGEKIEISKSQFKVGRKTELCDYSVSGNKTISRVHAILNIVDGQHLFIFDNNSLNKVFLNGKSIDPMVNTELHNGDVVRMGSERFYVIIKEE